MSDGKHNYQLGSCFLEIFKLKIIKTKRLSKNFLTLSIRPKCGENFAVCWEYEPHENN